MVAADATRSPTMTEPKSTPYACYDARYFLELIPGMVLIVAAIVVRFAAPRTPSMRLLALGLVSVGAAYTVLLTVAVLRRLDELQQRIHLIAIAVSFAATGVVVVMTRFLTMAG